MLLDKSNTTLQVRPVPSGGGPVLRYGHAGSTVVGEVSESHADTPAYEGSHGSRDGRT